METFTYATKENQDADLKLQDISRWTETGASGEALRDAGNGWYTSGVKDVFHKGGHGIIQRE